MEEKIVKVDRGRNCVAGGFVFVLDLYFFLVNKANKYRGLISYFR